MDIKGFIGISLVDWDGKNSSVFFLPNCNLRCPFCHNTKLVLQPAELSTIALDRITDYLQKNTKWIDGVVITGGEPTLHEDLPVLCQEIRKIGLSVKLDTNGTNPKMIKDLIGESLVDYIAMDLKAPLAEEKYSRVAGVNVTSLLPRIEQSIQMLLEGQIKYEFRTTLVPTIHKPVDIEAICYRIKGCKKYVIQNFRADFETVDPSFMKLSTFLNEDVNAFFQAARRIVPNTILRM